MEQAGDSDAAVPGSLGIGAFGVTLGEEEIPEILRRVATAIENIQGFQLLNIVVSRCDEEATASVYYWIANQ